MGGLVHYNTRHVRPVGVEGRKAAPNGLNRVTKRKNPMFFFDPLYLIMALPAMLLGLYAQSRVQGSFSKYSRVRTARGVTGAEVARYLLDSQGLYDVQIERVAGTLSDHYDPQAKIRRLSPPVYDSASAAAA